MDERKKLLQAKALKDLPLLFEASFRLQVEVWKEAFVLTLPEPSNFYVRRPIRHCEKGESGTVSLSGRPSALESRLEPDRWQTPTQALLGQGQPQPSLVGHRLYRSIALALQKLDIGLSAELQSGLERDVV